MKIPAFGLRMSLNVTVIALGLALILFLAGCVANRQYRTDFSAQPPGAAAPAAVIEAQPDYKLGFVEFDDQGWFWDRRQWDAVQAMARAEAAESGAVLVLFVHGWKNNAAADNDNVVMFRNTLSFLHDLEEAESRQENRPARRLVGIYAGWRGLSSSVEPFKELSFYERKNTAHRVGHGALTELMVRLEALQSELNRRPASQPRPAGDRASELVVIGHSFGGAAVYSAISQILLQRFVDNVEHSRAMKSFGDVVILLNPAFEASRHETLNELATRAKYSRRQEPVLAVFTSETDWATKKAFPIGRTLSGLFEKYRSDVPQKEEDRQTVGNYAPFLTHDLVYDPQSVPAPSAPAAPAADAKAAPRLAAPPTAAQADASVQRVRALRSRWQTSAAPAVAVAPAPPPTLAFTGARLVPRPAYPDQDPFLIVSVDPKIMDGHNDIANERLVRFLAEFIVFCRPEPGR